MFLGRAYFAPKHTEVRISTFRDVIDHVPIQFAVCHFLPVVHCSQASICNHLRDICIYTVSRKTVQTYLLSELCQILTDCENFWHEDNKEDKLFSGVLIFHLPNLCQCTTVLNAGF